MLSKILKKTFSQAKPSFNILNAVGNLKNVIRAPIKHIKRNLEATAVNNSPVTNTT